MDCEHRIFKRDLDYCLLSEKECVLKTCPLIEKKKTQLEYQEINRIGKTNFLCSIDEKIIEKYHNELCTPLIADIFIRILKKHLPLPEIEIKFLNKKTRVCGRAKRHNREYTIILYRHCIKTLIHELAHIADYYKKGYSGHNRDFAQNMTMIFMLFLHDAEWQEIYNTLKELK
jgi:hypothetical protein